MMANISIINNRNPCWLLFGWTFFGLSLSLVLNGTRCDAVQFPQKETDVLLRSVPDVQKLECEDGHEKMKNTFNWTDYSVLATMLIVSCGIGIFYGFFGPKHKTSSDFLLGGSSMGTLPMATSLTASFITAIELLGNPAEMYNYGTQFWMICVAFALVVPLTSRLYLPVFMTLRLTSSYEYLALRFSRQTSLLASGMYILQMTLYTSVAVYAPALALSHDLAILNLRCVLFILPRYRNLKLTFLVVTGLNVYLAITVVYVVCIFYASQGGMTAVIITDNFQCFVLVSSILLVLYLGERSVGNIGQIWSENYNSGRLELFNMNPSPTIRHSFWSVVVGGTFYWMTMFCSNQASIQKYLSVETISQARSALWISSVGLIGIFTINFYTGMILVTHYRNCNPITSGEISASDEILPLYVLSELGNMKGVTGFFVAGIFAASLGTVASALNSLSAVTFKDFITGALGIEMPESKEAFWAKSISIIYGLLSFGLVFIVEQLGSVMQVALSFNGMVGGVTLGLFSLGMFFPWANSRGATTGGIVATALVLWMGIGQQVAVANGSYTLQQKPSSIEQCLCLNGTEKSLESRSDNPDHNNNSDLFYLYRISYLWYSAIGFIVTITVGMIVSAMTGFQETPEFDSDLLSPAFREFYYSLPKSLKRILNIPSKDMSGNVALKGVINVIIDIKDEEVKETTRY